MKRLGVLLAALALVASSCGGSEAPDPATPDPALPAGIDGLLSLELIDGELTGGAQTAEFSIGDQIRIELTGNSEDTIHVHAYDFYLEPINGEGELEFAALIPGTFEIELEEAGRLLVRMTVS